MSVLFPVLGSLILFGENVDRVCDNDDDDNYDDYDDDNYDDEKYINIDAIKPKKRKDNSSKKSTPSAVKSHVKKPHPKKLKVLAKDLQVRKIIKNKEQKHVIERHNKEFEVMCDLSTSRKCWI